MTRRLPAHVHAFLALASAVLLVAARPSTSHADAIVADPSLPTFHLKNASASPVSTVDFSVLPPGTIVPPADGKSPLTLLDTSSGFDSSKYATFLSPPGTTFNGQPAQFLRLSFGAAGLQPGGEIDYQLSLADSFKGDLQLQLPADAANNLVSWTTPGVTKPAPDPVTATAAPEPTPVLLTGATPVVATPEPASVALWASLAGLGLLRARSRRRARPRAS